MRQNVFVWVLIAALAASVLLAGCVQPTPDAAPSLAYGPGFHAVPYRNLTLEPLAIPETVVPGQEHEWRIRVTHSAGSEDDFVYSSVCRSPWVISLSDAYGQSLHTDEQLFFCQAYGEARLAHGEHLDLDWNWDGRHHPDAGPEARDLAPGAYVLTFHFQSVRAPHDGPRAFHVFEVA